MGEADKVVGVKDYNLTINYDPKKANRVADTLNRKAIRTLATMLARQLQALDLEVVELTEVILETLMTQNPIHKRIITTQTSDAELGIIKESQEGISPEFQVGDDRTLCLKGRIRVPKYRDILSEAHNSKLSIHIRSTKMYRDLKRNFL
ncbi:UNVERIFIED_CONTAM: hypothetical protein Sradi_7035900 [Sesamum radiatum]|uniref:Uncharacterized protein n=1 Tax=Sesamum radiatum TaxID=300843 RepID=A0AAW2J9M6_SESRA